MQSAILFGAVTALPLVEGLPVGLLLGDPESGATDPKGEDFAGLLSLDAVPVPTDGYAGAWPISIAVPFAGFNPVGLGVAESAESLVPGLAAAEVMGAPPAGSDDPLPPEPDASAPPAVSDEKMPPEGLSSQAVLVPAQPKQLDQATPDQSATLSAARGPETADTEPPPDPWTAPEKAVKAVAETVTEAVTKPVGPGLILEERPQVPVQAKAEGSKAHFAAGVFQSIRIAAYPKVPQVPGRLVAAKVETDRYTDEPSQPAAAEDAKPRVPSPGSILAPKPALAPETLPEPALAQSIDGLPENSGVNIPVVARFRPRLEHVVLTRIDAGLTRIEPGPVLVNRRAVEPEFLADPEFLTTPEILATAETLTTPKILATPETLAVPETLATKVITEESAPKAEPVQGPPLPSDRLFLRQRVELSNVELPLDDLDSLTDQDRAARIAIPGALPTRPLPGFPASHLAFLETLPLADHPKEAIEAGPGLPLATPDPALAAGSDSGQFRADNVRVLVANLTQIVLQAAPQLMHARDGTTTLTLSPDELGQVRLSFQPDSRSPDQMTVMLTFDRPETMELFRRNADQLADALRQAGYSGVQIGFGSKTGEGTQGRADQQANEGLEPASLMPLPQIDTLPLAGLAAGLVALDLRL